MRLTDKLNQFQWAVAEGGHRLMMLRTAVPPEQPGLEAPTERLYLTASVVLGKTYPASLYSPPSGLFKTFAGLSTERDQIVGFANKWGMLTAGDPVLLNESSIGFGELFELWETEIRDLSFAVRIWDLLNSGDGVALSRYIKWKDDSQVWFARPADDAAAQRMATWLPKDRLTDSTQFISEWRLIADRKANADLLETFQKGDVVKPAWYQLQFIVNEKLAGNVSARLLWDASPSRQSRRLSLCQTPKNLISALWLQLARAIEGDREYQQCEECRNWFEVSSPDGGRTDKRFCGTACRARFWRKAKKGQKGEKE